MDENLVVNSRVGLEVYVNVRRRGMPLERVRLKSPEEMASVQPLLNAVASRDEETSRRAAVRLGLLVPQDEVPVARKDLGFHCDLDASVTDLIPPEKESATPLLAAEDLVVNPRIHVQGSPDLPVRVLPEFVDNRVVMGPSRFSDILPVIWVEHPVWGTLMPYTCRGTWGEDLRRVVMEGASHFDVSPEALRALHLAGVLLPRDGSSAAEASGSRERRESEGDVGVVRDLFSPFFLAGLRNYCRTMRAEGFFRSDRVQSRRREGMYSDAVTVFVQRQLQKVVAGWTGEQVKPSYTWLMTYKPGAVLERHRDRPQCRWNVSFFSDADPYAGTDSWPLFVEGAGKDHRIDLGIGDAVIYSGTSQYHWRDALAPGRSVTMGFLHYVKDDFTGSLS